MLHKVEGDILLTGAQVLAHGVAPNDPFDQGLALALRERWPAMYKDYRHYWKTHHPKVGEAWMWGGPGGVRIVNLMTQEPAPEHGHGHPGRATLHNVHKSLRELAKLVEKEGFESIALPRLATGVGGLDWTDVSREVEERLGSLSVPVYVYEKYVSGQKADEPGAG